MHVGCCFDVDLVVDKLCTIGKCSVLTSYTHRAFMLRGDLSCFGSVV